jgi:hypothetical protein
VEAFPERRDRAVPLAGGNLRPRGLAKQIVEDAAHPRGEDRSLPGIALGRLQVAPELTPAGTVVATDAVRVFQFSPPLPFHGERVSGRERLADDHVAVALEAPAVC